MKEPIPKRTKHFYSFGPFRLYVVERELFQGTEPVALAPKALDTLSVLVSKRGHVVEKDELMGALWPDTFVEEDSLVQQISHLRKALGDRPDGGPYIETVAKRGYRFAAPVTDSWEEEPTEARLTVADLGEEKPGAAGRRRLVWILAAACVLVIGTGVAGWLLLFRPGARAPEAEMRIVPFTVSLGRETEPAISPDGQKVAFCQTADIYVQQAGGETALQLTDTPEPESSPAWSPDSSQIAFCRKGNAGFTIHVKEALGGPEHKLGESTSACALDWSPNGEFLAFVDEASGDEPRSIYSLSIRTRERRRLTSPPLGSWDGNPAFSPGGRTLAFTRARHPWAHHIYLLPLERDGTATREPKRLTSEYLDTSGLDWAADGRSIVVSIGHRGFQSLWRIPVSGGEPQRLHLGDGLRQPSISRQADRLVCEKRNSNGNIYRVPGPNATAVASGGKGGSPELLISSTAGDGWPKYSPDGKKIVFFSFRFGSAGIWKCNSDGSNPVRLTELRCMRPHSWSPNGGSVAYDSDYDDIGNPDIYVVSAEGGPRRRLTIHDRADNYPSWSQDGKWVYFSSDRSGDHQIWRIPSEEGTAEQVTRNGGYEAFESADGRFIYYIKEYSVPGIWKVPVEGGEETRVLEDGEEDHWDLNKDGICFIAERLRGGRAIKFFRFSSQQIEHVTELPEGTEFGQGLSVSPDGRWVLYTRLEQWESDIMLVENFR